MNLPDRWSEVPVCVIGAGYMGSGIAQVLALAGAPVVVVDVDAERATAAVTALREQAATFEQTGLVPAGAAATVAANVSAGADLAAAVPGTQLIIEAVFEDLEVKRDVLGRAEKCARPDAALATNTSSIPIGDLAVALADPGRLLGVHWFNPPQFVPGVELIPGADTRPELAPWLRDLLRQAGKWPAVVSDTPGFVCNRLQFAMFREAVLMLEEGVASAEQIDEVVRGSFGYRLPFFGPFAVADMAGLDVYAGAYQILQQAYGDRFSAPDTLTRLVAEGKLGTKSGGGFLPLTPDQIHDMVRRRDRSYAELLALVDQAAKPRPA
jgi:3-hydroxybutyryl-CoA dehydrogenase